MIKEGNTRITVTLNENQVTFLQLLMSIYHIKTYGKAIRLVLDASLIDIQNLSKKD